MKGYRLRILYFTGILSVVVLLIFIYTQFMDTTTGVAPRIEHSSVNTGEKSILKFKIFNNEEQDINYTYAITLNDKELTGDALVLVRANGTFQYSIQIPPEKVGDGRANVLIYRDVGEGKMLIDNKTYFIR